MRTRVHPIKRIGIDLDNTVADYMSGAIPLMKEHYNLVPDFTRQATTIEEVFGLTKNTRPPNMRQHLYEELHLFRTLPKVETDVEDLTKNLYAKPWHKVYFITARTASSTIVEDTIFWLHSNGFVFDDIFFVDNKAELCRMMKINVMIEDEVGQLLNLRRTGIDCVVPNRPWNQHLPADPHHMEREQGRLARVNNWREALTAIEEFLE